MGEILFDRKLLEQNKKRHAGVFADHNFLFAEVANRISENVELLNRKFDRVLEIGARDNSLSSLLGGDFEHHDDAEVLSVEENSFDLIVSNLNLHFINELPQFLIQVRKALKPDGVFIASLFGEENLSELAHILYKSEVEIYDGVSPKMPPTIDVKTAAALLNKAGFSSPISDFEKIEVEYETPMKLLRDLKFMGQGNILTARSKRFFTRGFLNDILQKYQDIYGNSDGSVRATFEIVTIAGWKPPLKK
jgi:NADH dehydrogenase [ubiquinone] 1 alpha subcomplex assembly factor 5